VGGREVKEMATIALTDSPQDVFWKLSKGNPGALTVLLEITQIEPPLSFIQTLRFDDLGIYGPRIWMLYKDIFRGKTSALYFALKHSRLKKVIGRKKLVDIHFAKDWEYYQ